MLGALSPQKEETSLSTGTVQLGLRPRPSQKNTSEKAAFLLLVLCDFDSLVAALRAIAFQLLVHFCFDISCKSEKCILYVYVCFCTGLHEFNPETCSKLLPLLSRDLSLVICITFVAQDHFFNIRRGVLRQTQSRNLGLAFADTHCQAGEAPPECPTQRCQS